MKARTENKYIFIDCYTTWCGPCKRMDGVVYPNDTLGNFMNDKYISVKVQMDTSGKDNEEIKKWYGDARSIASAYTINAYPTFLFLSPEGKLVFRQTGYRDATEFMMLAGKALSRENLIYYEQLEQYKSGKKYHADLYELANYAKSLEENNLAVQIANDYLATTDRNKLIDKDKIFFVLRVANNLRLADSLAAIYKRTYLDKLDTAALLKLEHFEFAETFLGLINSKDGFFSLCYYDPEAVNRLMDFPTWSKMVLSSVITREELESKLSKEGHSAVTNSDWQQFEKTIQKKYPRVNAGELVVNYKTEYYKLLKNWPAYTSSVIEKVEKYGVGGPVHELDFNLNNNAWAIFLHSNNANELIKALGWSDSAIHLVRRGNDQFNLANWMDTKANILYKLGRAKEAIDVQSKVVEMDPNNPDFRATLEKMKKEQLAKPVIDTTAYYHWQSIERKIPSPYITNDGKFAVYYVNSSSGQHMIVQAVNGDWKREMADVKDYSVKMADDAKTLFFLNKEDSLCIVTLGTDRMLYIPSVASYKIPEGGNGEWVAYLFNRPARELILRNTITGKQRAFENVTDYSFNHNGSGLTLRHDLKEEGEQAILWLNLSNDKSTTLWRGKRAANMVFDAGGNQMAFCASGNDSSQYFTLYHYKPGMREAVALTGNVADQPLSFSEEGSKIFFKVISNATGLDSSTGYANVVVWNYKDQHLPTAEQYVPASFTASVNIRTKKTVVLEDGEVLLTLHKGNHYRIAMKRGGDDYYYNKENGYRYYAISVDDGTRKFITASNRYLTIKPSPSEHFIVWFDTEKLHYFSYETATGVIRNISQDVPVALYDDEAKKIGRIGSFDIAAWIAGKDEVLIYDRYDIWKVDMEGKSKPINITNGYGYKNHVAFGLLSTGQLYAGGIMPELLLKPDEAVWMTGFNTMNKNNGFWKARLNKRADPEMQSMCSCNYYVLDETNPRVGRTGYIEYASAGLPVKAKNSGEWLVMRMSATESPNLVVTKDFKKFSQLTYITPEKNYNWLTAELVNWTMPDGLQAQGILYKPQNFDPAKKYPLIFTYYEKRSDGLHQFLPPDFTYADINIPSYVSNGYLVFVPDIHFTQGHNGKSIVKAVVSAARFLCSFPWVDSTKLGLQGHSFGGAATNMLITQSNMFAAACEVAGVCNAVSGYGQLSGAQGEFGSRQPLYEIDSQGSPYGIGVTPWTNPELYMENSPIFYIGHVTTPLLMMHGDRDGAVPFAQAIEMYLGMRRAGKKVWLLQYKNAGHALQGDDAKDFTIRMQQFFDHYLKEAPAPGWLK